MGKYDSYIIQKILFIKAPLLFFTVEYSKNLLCCAPKMFKIFDPTSVYSSDYEDEMDYSSESYGGEIGW